MALGSVQCITLGTSPHRYSDAASHTPMASCVRDTMLQQWAQPRGRKEKLIYSCSRDELMGAFRSLFQLPLAGKCWWHGSWTGSNQWDNEEPYSSLRHAQTVPHNLKKPPKPNKTACQKFGLGVFVCFGLVFLSQIKYTFLKLIWNWFSTLKTAMSKSHPQQLLSFCAENKETQILSTLILAMAKSYCLRRGLKQSNGNGSWVKQYRAFRAWPALKEQSEYGDTMRACHYEDLFIATLGL